MEGGCLGYPGHASVASQRLHRICEYGWQIPATQPWASMRHCYFLFLKIPKGALSRLSLSFNYRIYLNKRRPPPSNKRRIWQGEKTRFQAPPRNRRLFAAQTRASIILLGFASCHRSTNNKVISRRSRAKMAKKFIKCDARAKLLFC